MLQVENVIMPNTLRPKYTGSWCAYYINNFDEDFPTILPGIGRDDALECAMAITRHAREVGGEVLVDGPWCHHRVHLLTQLKLVEKIAAGTPQCPVTI